jgi:RNA polymerase sigma-70 factor, ECF subfamily
MPLTLVKALDQNTSDTELAQRIAQGDHGAIEALMRRYNQRLYRVARSILRNDADAEEAVQEAFYLAYRAMGKFRGDSRLSTWLVRIVVNESNKRLRKINRLSTWLEFNEDPQDNDEALEENMDRFSPDQPEQAMVRAQTRHLIETRIDRLPDAFRAVFVLRAVEELSVEETAHCLGIQPATVRSRYFRARGLLRKLLGRGAGGGLEEVFSFAGDRCDRIVAHVLARI